MFSHSYDPFGFEHPLYYGNPLSSASEKRERLQSVRRQRLLDAARRRREEGERRWKRWSLVEKEGERELVRQSSRGSRGSKGSHGSRVSRASRGSWPDGENNATDDVGFWHFGKIDNDEENSGDEDESINDKDSLELHETKLLQEAEDLSNYRLKMFLQKEQQQLKQQQQPQQCDGQRGDENCSNENNRGIETVLSFPSYFQENQENNIINNSYSNSSNNNWSNCTVMMEDDAQDIQECLSYPPSMIVLRRESNDFSFKRPDVEPQGDAEDVRCHSPRLNVNAKDNESQPSLPSIWRDNTVNEVECIQDSTSYPPKTIVLRPDGRLYTVVNNHPTHPTSVSFARNTKIPSSLDTLLSQSPTSQSGLLSHPGRRRCDSNVTNLTTTTDYTELTSSILSGQEGHYDGHKGNIDDNDLNEGHDETNEEEEVDDDAPPHIIADDDCDDNDNDDCDDYEDVEELVRSTSCKVSKCSLDSYDYFQLLGKEFESQSLDRFGPLGGIEHVKE